MHLVPVALEEKYSKWKFFKQAPLNLFVYSIHEELKKTQVVGEIQRKEGFDTIL